MTKDLYLHIMESLKKKHFSVLATITGQSGSTPRGIGTQFIIREDGSSLGTIGGGLLESLVVKASREVFASHLPLRFNHVLKGTDSAGTDMLCGGDVEVFLEPVSPDRVDHQNILEKVVHVLRKGGSGILATVMDADQWQGLQVPKMFIDSKGEKIGSLLGMQEIEENVFHGMDSFLLTKQPGSITFPVPGGNPFHIFIEPVISDPLLYLFGGGHVSSCVAPLAHQVGFKVVVIDDRPEFSDPARFPSADEVRNYRFEDVMDRLTVNESSYIVIVTHGHKHDKTVLAQALRTPAGYIGMIGSRRKISIIFEKLVEEGFSRKELEKVYSPIGIDIGAETPDEIAVSIVAELIKVRSGA